MRPDVKRRLLREALLLEQDALRMEQDAMKEEFEDLASECEGYHQCLEDVEEVGSVVPEERRRVRRLGCTLSALRAHSVERVKAAYPIVLSASNNYSICGAELSFGKAEEVFSTALGYMSHVLVLLSKYFQVPLRYQLCYHASRSFAKDNVDDVVYLFHKTTDSAKRESAVKIIVALVEQMLAVFNVEYVVHRPLLYNLSQLVSTAGTVVSSRRGASDDRRDGQTANRRPTARRRSRRRDCNDPPPTLRR